MMFLMTDFGAIQKLNLMGSLISMMDLTIGAIVVEIVPVKQQEQRHQHQLQQQLQQLQQLQLQQQQLLQQLLQQHHKRSYHVMKKKNMLIMIIMMILADQLELTKYPQFKPTEASTTRIGCGDIVNSETIIGGVITKRGEMTMTVNLGYRSNRFQGTRYSCGG